MEFVEGKNACPFPNCNSSDGFHWYGEGKGGYCYVCEKSILSAERKAELGMDSFEWTDEMEVEVVSKQLLTKEEVEQIKGYTGTKGKGARNILDETYSAYGVRFKYDEQDGHVVETFYPYTQDFAAAGFKSRIMNPKDFRSVGKIGKDSDLFGQWKWKQGGGKYVLLTAGEADALAAFQMLETYRKGRGSDFEPIPVVSSGIGESGSYKQVQLHYEWLNSHARILVAYDQDDAGKKAVEKLMTVLPKGKTFIVNLPMKDVNAMLDAGKQKQFISCFYDAKPYTPTGIVGSSQLFSAILEEANVEKLEFPPFMAKLNDMFAGGASLGTIGTISASTGLGKSSLVNEMVYHWIYHSPHKIGVVSMEQNKGQYGELMLSREVGAKLGKMKPQQKRDFLALQSTIDAQKRLFTNEDGTDRWMVVDDRDGDTESLKAAIEQLIIACDCKVIILDTISDMFDGLSTDEQAVLMKWQKSIVNRYNVLIINISHQRKAPSGTKDGGEGAMGNESSLHGTSTLTKSSAWIIMLARNKMAEDIIEKNTTKVGVPKNRGAGETGDGGSLFYDNQTHTMHDLDAWLRNQHHTF